MERIRIQFKDLYIGMVVEDLDPNFGLCVITNCDDIHNVSVFFGINEGFGFYCLDENCISNDYVPLYYTVKDGTILSRKLKLKRILKDEN